MHPLGAGWEHRHHYKLGRPYETSRGIAVVGGGGLDPALIGRGGPLVRLSEPAAIVTGVRSRRPRARARLFYF
jgi:hypothetical protein